MLLKLAAIFILAGVWALMGWLAFYAAPPGMPWFIQAGIMALPLAMTLVIAHLIAES